MSAPTGAVKKTSAPTHVTVRMEDFEVYYAGKTATTVTALILVGLLLTLWLGYKTPEVVVFMFLIFCWDIGLLTSKDALAGFSNSSMLAVGALFVSVAAVEKAQFIERISMKIFGLRTGMYQALFRLITFNYVLSGFFNNTPQVVLFIPIVRDWCRMRGFDSSIFLIPLSYSTIMGGLLTTIGASTNLVINGIITQSGLPALKFFDPFYVGIVSGIVGCVYLTFSAPTLLKSRGSGMLRDIRDRTENFITELQVDKTFPHLGQAAMVVTAKLGVPPDSLIKLRRPLTLGKSLDGEKKTEPEVAANTFSAVDTSGQRYHDIFPVPSATEILEGDILFLACPTAEMTKFQADAQRNNIRGVQILDVQSTDIAGFGKDFYELVLGNHNKFVGLNRPVSNQEFGKHYGCTILGLRTHSLLNQAPTGDEPGSDTSAALGKLVVKDHHLVAGDTVLVLANEDFAKKWHHSGEFWVISQVGKVGRPVRPWDLVPVLIFALMILWVSFEQASMTRAAFTAAAVLLIGGWIGDREAVESVEWSLLLLIASSLGLSKVISNSGMADYIGRAVKRSGVSPHASLTLMFIFTMSIAELITANAAGALTAPIGLAIAKEQNISYKPFMITVMQAASASFLTPIGYQTNTMVWGPGNYKFTDFAKIGFPLSILFMGMTIIFAPIFFPFGNSYN